MPAGRQPTPHRSHSQSELSSHHQPSSARAGRRARWGSWACATLLSAASPAHAAPDLTRPPLPLIAAHPVSLPLAKVQSIFHIKKSENRNQVHYGARVDEACRPIGSAPIYAYWRMLERGPNQSEALLSHEQPAYGIGAQQVLTRTNVRVQLRAWPDRPMRIELFRTHTGCAARALLDLQHQPAVIQSIYIDLGFLFSINYALVRGTRLQDGQPVQEKLRR